MLQHLNNKNNKLLQRDEIGIGKKCTYVLPDTEFRYGKESGVEKSLHVKEQFDWQIHQPSPQNQKYKDFKKLNRIQLSNKAINAKQNNNLDNNIDCFTYKKVANGQVVITLPDDQFTYGQKASMNNHMEKIINNVYQKEAEKDIQQLYKQHNEKLHDRKMEKIRMNKYKYVTKINNINNNIEVNNDNKSKESLINQINPNNFVLPKFRNIKSKLNLIRIQ